MAHIYFSGYAGYTVAGFVVDAAYVGEGNFCGFPLVASEEAAAQFAPESYEMFVALSFSKRNALRKDKCLWAKASGYRVASYVSPQATVLNQGAIGENCVMLEDNTIQPRVTIGHTVTLWSGNHVGQHSAIGDDTFMASHVVVSGGVRIGEQCFIGVNATLRDHIHVGDRCVVGAGPLLLADAEPDGVYIGAATERSRVPSSRLRGL